MKDIVLAVINFPIRIALIFSVTFLSWRGKQIPPALEDLVQRSIDLSEPLNEPTPLRK